MRKSKAWMRLRHALDHHGASLKSLDHWIRMYADESRLFHYWDHWRDGANSNFIVLRDCPFNLYLAGRDHQGTDPRVEVRYSARGKVQYVLRNERDVVRMFEAVVKTQQTIAGIKAKQRVP